MAPRKRLGQLLIEMGVIDEHQLNSALGHQKQWGGKLGSVLVQKNLCKEADVVRVLSVHLGMPVIHLAALPIDPRAVKLVSRQIAEKLRVFPVELSGAGRGEVLTIAMAEPSDLSIVDQIAFHTGKRIKPALTGESEIAAAIALYYSDAAGQSKLATPIASQRYSGSAPAARPPSISQRPAPPHIAPPVMAPVARPDAAVTTAPFGQIRPALRPVSSSAAASAAAPAASYLPPPDSSFASSMRTAPLEEIEAIDLESIPGMPPAPPGAPLEGLEPIAAEPSPQPTSWDEAPRGDPEPAVSWDDPPAEPVPEADREAAQPALAAAAEELLAWTDVELSEPPPAAEPEPRAPEQPRENPFGAARDWSEPLGHQAPRADETTDELPADAILGTAEENAAEPKENATESEARSAEPALVEHAARAAPVAVAPDAFTSEPGSILAPDAWGEVADPLAEAAHASSEPPPAEAPAIEPSDDAPAAAQTAAPIAAQAAEPAADEPGLGDPLAISDEFPIVHEAPPLESALEAHAGDEPPLLEHPGEEAGEAAPQAEPGGLGEELRAQEPSEELRAQEEIAHEPADVPFSAEELAPDEPVAPEEPAFAAPEDASVFAAPAEPAHEEAAQAHDAAEAAPSWEAPPPETQESAGWLGQAIAETTPLSAYDVETLAGVGIDPGDGMGALRLLAGLLRALAARELIDFGELTVDLYAQRSEAAPAASAELAAHEAQRHEAEMHSAELHEEPPASDEQEPAV